MFRNIRNQMEFPVVVIMLILMKYNQRTYDAFYAMAQRKLFKWQWRVLEAIFKWRSNR